MFTFQAKLNRSSHGSSGGYELKALCALVVTAFALLAATVQPAEADPLAVKVGVIHQAHSRDTISISTSLPRTTSSPARAWG